MTTNYEKLKADVAACQNASDIVCAVMSFHDAACSAQKRCPGNTPENCAKCENLYSIKTVKEERNGEEK